MDTNVEDRMYRQIEKSLSNNINENLFLTGRILEEKKNSVVTPEEVASRKITSEVLKADEITPITTDSEKRFAQLSRAEYIRQAREACLRQMNAAQNTRTVDTYFHDNDMYHQDKLTKKRSRALNLFQDSNMEEESEQEIASFRFLIIRMVCAIIIFLCIFAVDKFQVKWGSFNHEVVQEFVTGKDQMNKLESIIVSWLD
ncbi:hypothetical protein I5677_08790 [Mobilitalea sibirica]|uniref:Uncharacterized protein n=1 Tax=Mobilitalea sibirica TaxID=1462919 RepID=A0A8J7H9C3_9FIRM|nr:hypothetical protein [Mobilitalea sibirica]MBH1940985.1 hypothetical protein [Mobilitalea sibirica]